MKKWLGGIIISALLILNGILDIKKRD